MNTNKTYLTLGFAGVAGLLTLWEYLGRKKEQSMLTDKSSENDNKSEENKKDASTPLYVTIRPSTVVNGLGTGLYNASGYGTENFTFRMVTATGTVVLVVSSYGLYSGKLRFPKLLKN